MRLSGFLLTIVGSALVALSFVWAILFPAEDRWTPQQAEEHAKAGTHFHKLAHGGHAAPKGQSHSQGKSQTKASKAELEAARIRWEESKSQLTAAQTKGDYSALWLRYSGVAVAIIGVAALVLDKRRSAKSEAKPNPFGMVDE